MAKETDFPGVALVTGAASGTYLLHQSSTTALGFPDVRATVLTFL